ncbi:MAG TPA: hypothetical protein VGY99_15060 [Candidatus Binataceae bacterium]|jgi:hypothetical protein|nr:hypothetical protein [Candidatus Binataceae bacterium]
MAMGAERLRKWLIVGAALILSACTTSSSPSLQIEPPLQTQTPLQTPPSPQKEPMAVPKPIEGQLSVVAQSEEPIGNLIPVYIAIANGTDEDRTIHPSQVFALDHYGERIAPIPSPEAARKAGGVQKLEAAVKSGVIGGADAGVVGVTPASPAGVVPDEARNGSASAAKVISPEHPKKVQGQPDAQIPGLTLNDTELRKNFTVSGFVFFPKGSYTDLEMVVVNNQTGGKDTIKVHWR